MRCCHLFCAGMLIFWANVALAVDVQVHEIGISFPDPMKPFIATDADPVTIEPETSLRLIWPSVEVDGIAATIDVAPMPPELSLEEFWPEYLEGLQEESEGGGIEERDWKRGALYGKAAESVARDEGGAANVSKVYMLALKGDDAFVAIELRIAEGQDAKLIEREIDLALTKAKMVKQEAP